MNHPFTHTTPPGWALTPRASQIHRYIYERTKHSDRSDSHTDTGANASAEEADEGTEDAEIKVNNIVHSFRLQSTQFDKKSFLGYLKGA